MAQAILKRYIIRKYVYAKSVAEALRKENQVRPDDAFLDENWKQETIIGFKEKK